MASSETITIDQKLIQRISNGDENAFRKLFDQYYPMMVSKANMILNDEALAKDAVQNVFVGIWNNRANLNITSSLQGYLVKSAINKSLNLVASRKKHGGSELTVESKGSESSNAQQEMEASEMKVKISPNVHKPL